LNEENLEVIENQEPDAETDQTAPAAEQTVEMTVPDSSADLGVDENTGESSAADPDITEIFPEGAADMSDTIVSGRGRTLVATQMTAHTIQIDASDDTREVQGGSPDAEQSGEKQPADPAAGSSSASQEDDPEIEAIKNKIRERKREKIRKARRRRIRFWVGLALVFAVIDAFAFSISGFFTVDSIEVRGNHRYTAEEIINIAHAVPGHNLLYDPGKQEIVSYLEQNPYIKSAEVTRKLPSTLVITVVERIQACAFKYDDDFLIMDDEGILLKKTRTEPKITMVRGLIVSKIKLGETVGTENQKLFSNTLKLIKAMNAADMYFVAVDMSTYDTDFQVRAYIYDNLVVRGEYESLMSFLENGRLHKIVEKLFEDDVKRGTIILGNDGTASFEPGI